MTAANADMYTNIAIEAQRLMFSLARAPSSVKKLPTFFTMMGGPAVGLRGLQTVIKSVLRAACVPFALRSLRSALTDAGVFRSFNWSRVVVYYQADPDDQKLADEFSNYALSNKLQIDFQRRQDSSRPDEDQRLLLTAEANVFVFFGGYGIALPLLLALWDVTLLLEGAQVASTQRHGSLRQSGCSRLFYAAASRRCFQRHPSTVFLRV